MYWSAATAALMPAAGVVTVTSTGPRGAAAGAVAVIWVALFTVKAVAAVAPNFTALGAGEVGARDRDRGPTGGRARSRAHTRDRRHRRHAPGRDADVLDPVDVVEPAGRARESDEHVGRQAVA